MQNTVYQVRQFTVDKATRTFTVEASDIGFGSNTLVMQSARTGRLATFKLSETVRDRELDVRFWTLQPTAETISQIPELAGWRVVVFND